MPGREALYSSGMRLGLLLIATMVVAQEPVFKSGVAIVEVPLVAKDSSDRAIADLRRSDLRVFDNGVEQAILSFEKMSGAAGPTGQPAARLSILLIDALNVDWVSQNRARKAAIETLATLQQGPDKIAIFAMGDKLKLLHDFSRDAASLREAIENYPGERPLLGVDQTSSEKDFYAEHTAPPPTPGNGPMARLAPKNPELSMNAGRGENRTLATLDALAEVARLVKGAPVEKNLIWITAGFTPSGRMHEDIRRTMQTLADAKILLYPVDARGVLSSSQALNQAMNLNELAGQTGGQVYMNSNQTASLIGAAIEDSRDGYVLTYTPTNGKEVSAHVIRLETSRKGVSLRYRPGYLSAQ